jgi:hypothetical protein
MTARSNSVMSDGTGRPSKAARRSSHRPTPPEDVVVEEEVVTTTALPHQTSGNHSIDEVEFHMDRSAASADCSRCGGGRPLCCSPDLSLLKQRNTYHYLTIINQF